MSNNKQTATEWLYKLSKQRELDAFDLEKAKEMEKEDRFNSIMHFLRECVPAKLIEYYSKTPLN
jgi:hypothetical protein